MTREFFNKQWAGLWAAFLPAQKIVDESQDVYWRMLKDLPEDKFAAGVQKWLAAGKFFPTIAKLGYTSFRNKNITARGSTRFHTVYLNWHEQLLQEESIKEKIRLLEDRTDE